MTNTNSHGAKHASAAPTGEAQVDPSATPPPALCETRGEHSLGWVLRGLVEPAWRPIESAPRDGTMFLAYNPMFGAYSTSFCKSWDTDNDGYAGFPCGFINGHFGRWDCQPTHWMPLPTPPVTP